MFSIFFTEYLTQNMLLNNFKLTVHTLSFGFMALKKVSLIL